MDKRLEYLPLVREGVTAVRSILHLRLSAYLAQKHPERDPAYIDALAGAVCSDVFGTGGANEFFRDHREEVAREAALVAVLFNDLRILLTDALRISVLMDRIEGSDTQEVLRHARDLGVLVTERDDPRPGAFLGLVRRVAAVYGIGVGQGVSRG